MRARMTQIRENIPDSGWRSLTSKAVASVVMVLKQVTYGSLSIIQNSLLSCFYKYNNIKK